jgi:hypothetical protein
MTDGTTPRGEPIRRCHATTKSGRRCRRPQTDGGGGLCKQHALAHQDEGFDEAARLEEIRERSGPYRGPGGPHV